MREKGSFSGVPCRWDGTTANHTSDASTSTIKDLFGSGIFSMGTLTKRSFSY